jgi:methyl-accepting chemotaxis protein
MASIAVTLLVSHKLAGPIFRFEKDLEEIGKGNLTLISRLRDGDQLTDFAKSISNMTASLHDKVLEIQKDVEQLEKSASQKDVPKEIIAELNHLHQKIGSNFQL